MAGMPHGSPQSQVCLTANADSIMIAYDGFMMTLSGDFSDGKHGFDILERSL